MEKPKICIAGSSNMDLVTSVTRMPLPGETIHGSGFNTYFGGKGANQAIMAAKLGGQVAMIAKVGSDGFGQQYLDNYKANGLVMDYVYVTDEVPTGIAAITVDEKGQNCIIVVGGANNAITPADIERAAPIIRASKAAVCQLEIPLESTIRFLELARSFQVPTIFNPAPAQDLPDSAYQLSDFFCPNETEAALMAGIPVDSLADAEKAANVFLKRGARAVIMTLGGNGSLLVTPEETTHVPTEKVQAVDTTGAGDAFIGSVAYFVAAGLPVTDAMRKASFVAALSVQRHGAQTSYPTWQECGF